MRLRLYGLRAALRMFPAVLGLELSEASRRAGGGIIRSYAGSATDNTEG